MEKWFLKSSDFELGAAVCSSLTMASLSLRTAHHTSQMTDTAPAAHVIRRCQGVVAALERLMPDAAVCSSLTVLALPQHVLQD